MIPKEHRIEFEEERVPLTAPSHPRIPKCATPSPGTPRAARCCGPAAGCREGSGWQRRAPHHQQQGRRRCPAPGRTGASVAPRTTDLPIPWSVLASKNFFLLMWQTSEAGERVSPKNKEQTKEKLRKNPKKQDNRTGGEANIVVCVKNTVHARSGLRAWGT